MFEITHQKAKRLLQKAIDQSLETEELSTLDAHLENCVLCRNYANDLSDLESGLRRILHAQFDNKLPDLNLQSIINPTMNLNWKSFFSLTNALGRVTFGITLVLGYLIFAKSFGGDLILTDTRTPTTIPTPYDSTLTSYNSPTPSIPPSLISLATQGCETVIYVIQKNDTLDNIARQFGVSKKLIYTYNNLKTDKLLTGRELSIPICEQTPSQLSHTPRNMTTITPLSETKFPAQRE